MSKIFVNCFWEPYHYTLEIEYNKNVEVFLQEMPTSIIPENTIRIIGIQEPELAIKKRMLNYLINNKKYYNYIFTYHQDILNRFDNAKLFIGACTWVHGYNFPAKTFSVSTVVGGKMNNEYEGYKLRHELWHRQNEIKIPKRFYLSSQGKLKNVNYDENLVLYEEKEPLFDSQFSISIENTSMINMFSEKLIDCFQTKTIPIYYGSKNIDDFFNVEGIFIVNNVNDIINICNNLTPEIYETKISIINENYEKSKLYSSFDTILKNKIIELLKEKYDKVSI